MRLNFFLRHRSGFFFFFFFFFFFSSFFFSKITRASPSSSSEKFKTALVRVSDAYFMRACVARALLCCC
jgi:uncharacterized membrane protein